MGRELLFPRLSRILSPIRIVLALGLATFAGTEPGLCADLSISPFVASPGASVPVAVLFENNGPAVSGLQFDVSVDNSALSLAAVVGSAARGSGKSLYVAPLAANRTRFLLWQFSQNPIQSGTIVNLFVNIAPAAIPGTYHIHFETALATDTSGHSVLVSTSDGTLTVQSGYGAPILPQSVLNGASLLPGSVAPGEIITILGSAIGSSPGLDGITFDGLPAPLTYMSSGQVNAVVPFGIAGRTTTTLDVVNASRTSTRISLPVAPSAPGIFTLGGSGAGRGAILNEDLTLNSPDNPAERGLIIVIYATGAGQTNPPGTDG